MLTNGWTSRIDSNGNSVRWIDQVFRAIDVQIEFFQNISKFGFTNIVAIIFNCDIFQIQSWHHISIVTAVISHHIWLEGKSEILWIFREITIHIRFYNTYNRTCHSVENMSPWVSLDSRTILDARFCLHMKLENLDPLGQFQNQYFSLLVGCKLRLWIMVWIHNLSSSEWIKTLLFLRINSFESPHFQKTSWSVDLLSEFE